jgi:hypothetical protein
LGILVISLVIWLGLWIRHLTRVNTTFNDISVISWRSVLLVEETTDLPQVTDKLYHIMLYRVHIALAGFVLTTLVEIGTDCLWEVINPTTKRSWPRWPPLVISDGRIAKRKWKDIISGYYIIKNEQITEIIYYTVKHV